jgi:hypothetical protein
MPAPEQRKNAADAAQDDVAPLLCFAHAVFSSRNFISANTQ